jgi:hypothetical protein
MKFIFAENMDLVDPNFDFIKDRSSSSREPYWDDVYPHQLLGYAPYNGLLVSRAIVGGHVKSGKYNESQAMRFRREGARKFLRFEESDYPQTVMWGDCGAFAYADEEVPPYSVDDIVDFYADGQFTHGCSVDHIIFDYCDSDFDFAFDDAEVRRRQEITLSNAAEFIVKSRDRIGNHFTPVGVVHGWSPKTMANAAEELVKMGYNYLALGGMVPLKAEQIRGALQAVRAVIPRETQVHILGFAKAEEVHSFLGEGLDSVDTTSPLLRAFKDAKANYYEWNGEGFSYYAAIRVPQVLTSPPLKRMVQAGKLELEEAVGLERSALNALREYDSGAGSMEAALQAVRDYWILINSELAKTNPAKANKEVESITDRIAPTLSRQPWKKCGCKICESIGIEVVIFRGNNRNRRRGVHNLHVYGQRLRELKGL